MNNPKALPQVKGINFSFLSSSLSSLPIVLAFIVHSLYTMPLQFHLTTRLRFSKPDRILQAETNVLRPFRAPGSNGKVERCRRARSVEGGVDDRQLFVRPHFGVRMIFLPLSLSLIGGTQHADFRRNPLSSQGKFRFRRHQKYVQG